MVATNITTNIAMGIADGASADGLTQAIIGLTEALRQAIAEMKESREGESVDLLEQIVEGIRSLQSDHPPHRKR